jgi:hypothetical protein
MSIQGQWESLQTLPKYLLQSKSFLPGDGFKLSVLRLSSSLESFEALSLAIAVRCQSLVIIGAKNS